MAYGLLFELYATLKICQEKMHPYTIRVDGISDSLQAFCKRILTNQIVYN
jgi:hypothetical protein